MPQAPEPEKFMVARPVDEASVCRIESQTEVASSAAFQAIDDQYHAGNLTSTEMAVYKVRYMKMYDGLKRTRENEFNLVQLSKRHMSEIEEQVQELNKVDQFPDNAVTEPSQMRTQILNYYNSAMATHERVEMLQYEAQLLKEERKLLNRDYSRLPTAEEMERRMKIVQNACQDLWLEIDMLKMETKRSREQLRQVVDVDQELKSELISLGQRKTDIKAEWVLATDLPGQYSKEAEKARKYKSNAEKELQNLQQEFTELSETQAKLELDIRLIETEERVDREELQASRVVNTDRKQTLDKTVKMHETWYEMEMMNRTEKARFLQRIHLAEQKKKDHAEELAKLQREKETFVRHWKKVEGQIELLNDSVRVVQQFHDKARARYIVTPRYDGEMVARKRRLARAIENLQQDLIDEQKRTANEVAHLSRTVGMAERRLSLMQYLRAENWELIRLTTGLSEALGKAIFEFTTAKTRYEHLLEDLNLKDKEIQEDKKVLDDLQVRLTDVSTMYTKMKLERNKCVGLLQASVKLALDTRERLRIHMNEAEIIIFKLQRHDKELFRERSLYGTAISHRDHKRAELCKVSHQHSEQMNRREQMRRSIQCINSIFNQTEADMLSVKKAKERCAQVRNERAILLIERNQEVYILQERIIAQDNAARAGDLTVGSLSMECRRLSLYRSDLLNYIGVIKNQMPTFKRLTIELLGFKHELIGSQMELARLVEIAEDPDVPGRLRLLAGKDPAQHELWITLGHLERRMAAKEEDMAEKNLTYEAVCRLVDSLQVRASAGKDDTLILAMEVNKVKDRLLQLRNYMKTMYAELVVCGAERNQLTEQVMMTERMLDVYAVRMRVGHAPNSALQQTWQTSIRLERLSLKPKKTGPIKILPMRPAGTMPIRGNNMNRDQTSDMLYWKQTAAEETTKVELKLRPKNINRNNPKTLNQTQRSNANSSWKSHTRLPPMHSINPSMAFNQKCIGETNLLDSAIVIRPVPYQRPHHLPTRWDPIQQARSSFSTEQQALRRGYIINGAIERPMRTLSPQMSEAGSTINTASVSISQDDPGMDRDLFDEVYTTSSPSLSHASPVCIEFDSS